MGDIQRLYLISALASLLGGASYSILAPYLRLLGFSPIEYGFLGALLLFTSLLFTAIAGWASDRVGAKEVMTASLFLQSFSTLLLAFGSTPSVIFSFLLSGVSGGLAAVAGVVLATRVSGGEQLERALPFLSAASTIGGGIGHFGGWVPVLLSSLYSVSLLECYRLQFLAIALLLPLLTLPFLLGLKEIRGPQRAEGGSPARVPWGVLARLVLINAIISLGAGMSIHIIDYYFVLKFNVQSGELGTVLGIQNLLMGLLMLLTPKVSVAVGGPLRAYLLIASPSILFIVAMTLTSNYAISSSIYIVRTILMNVANPLYHAFEMSLIPSEYRGRGASLISIAWQLPAGVGRIIGGALMTYNVEAPLLATAALYALSFSLMFLFFPSYVLRRNSRPP
ncbi:MAG: MFS transporter [Acidilobaceae archaeon]